MKINVSTTPVKDLWQEGLVLGLFSDDRPPRGFAGMVDWRLNGAISRSMVQGRLQGSRGEEVLLYPDCPSLASRKILLVGLGELERLTGEVLYEAGRTMMNTMRGINCRDFATAVPGIGRCELPVSVMTDSLLAGMLDCLGASADGRDRLITIHIIGSSPHLPVVAEALRERAARTDYDVTVDLMPDRSAGRRNTDSTTTRNVTP